AMQKSKATQQHRLAVTLAANVFVAGLLFGPVSVRPALTEPAASLTAPVPANAPEASEINAFQEVDRKQMPPARAVLFIGSSSIRMWTTLAQDFPEIPVINRGFGGSL